MDKQQTSPSLLHHLDNLTRHRDSTLLQKSVMDSLIAFVSVDSIRLYDISSSESNFYISLSAIYKKDEPHINEFEAVVKFKPLSEHPLFIEILQNTTSITNAKVGNQYLCCIPIMVNDTPISIFELSRTTRFELTEIDVFRGILAVFRNYLSLLEDSQRDTLTNLHNRKTFDQGFSSLLEEMSDFHTKSEEAQPTELERRSRQYSQQHWLAVVDIDHFKRINDQFGHLYGDEVLILMANIMRSSFRRHDRLYRFGGEEFIVLLRNLDEETAYERLEQFRKKMEAYDFPQVGTVTISIGFTMVTPSDSPSQVIGHADEALYFAKEHGRNQVQRYESLKEQGLVAEKTVHTDIELF
ncbi:GGDEF domain-containing protein [Candidatus Methylospira mobilis]|uniref:GGDEF domain-containing protein n=1 Tax=Candidatus Methylospira mobilis TaxID=1808979 RepID=UPI0028E49521|nr:GGDEF domain-containing protein [Candidatus Methylospira mobilis]WNV05327.1 GGDEF domain-containing protein [Candidatus Methylospira mobilis]